jgi:gas vesicle protein
VKAGDRATKAAENIGLTGFFIGSINGTASLVLADKKQYNNRNMKEKRKHIFVTRNGSSKG